MKKRFLLAAVMAMCMMVMVMPAAFAEGGTYESDEAAISDNKVFRIGEEGTDGAYYATLGDAVAAVQEGESTPTTIVLLKDASGGGVSINNKNIIFDFGGHTYTVGEPTVGSAGTETNGFQLLRGSTIKMTNGTLKASNYPNLKIMIQNYCDLTLEDVNLDASEALQCQYVASNNCGEVEIIGSTNITAASGQVAFDVCWWPTSYSEGVQVTINTTGNITGNIELGTYGSLTGHEISASTLTIEQGTFSGEIEVSTELETQATEKISISGGTFTHADVSAYLVDTVKQDSTTGQVRPLKESDPESVASIGTDYYRSLQAAINAAGDGAFVTLVADVEQGDGVIIPSGKNITIDFDNHIYTVTQNPAGSSGTKNQCFQLLKDSNIVMKNGAIVAGTDKVLMMIQNYSNLTLENMVLDATEGTNAVNYVLSNNCGEVLLTGNTSITAKETGKAMDVSYWPSAYPAGTQVTIDTTGTITGTIEIGLYGSNGSITLPNTSILTIDNVVHEGEITTYNPTSGDYNTGLNDEEAKEVFEDKCVVTNGRFSSDVSAYCIDGFTAEQGQDGKYTIEMKDNMAVTVTDADGNTVGAYETLDEAIAVAQPGDTVKLTASIDNCANKITLPAEVTLDGDGKSITYTGTDTSGAFLTAERDSNNVAVKNITINANNITHGVQFYCNNGGSLENVIVNGGTGTSVIVNGATNVTIKDSQLNPVEDFYATIEYGMGEVVTTAPSFTLNNVTTSDSDGILVWADTDTVDRVIASGTATADNVADVIAGKITTINNDSITIAVAPATSSGGSVEIIETPSTKPVVSNPTYTITNPSVTGGTVTVSPRSASRGRLVTLTVTPDEGYELASLTVTDSRGNTVTLTDAGNGKYTFTMPGSRVVVNAAFQLASLPFTDVAEGAWYYDAIAYVYRNGLMAGVSSTQFAPDSTLNRATLATILWRLAGEPVVNYALPFEDVAEGEWYSEAIRWAASTGIVNGTTPTTFRPFNSVTREQMAAMVHRYAEYMGYDTTASTDLDTFTDAASVNSYAAQPLSWCVAEGLISGIGTEIRPQSSATRAQIATMLMRFCENIAK